MKKNQITYPVQKQLSATYTDLRHRNSLSQTATSNKHNIASLEFLTHAMEHPISVNGVIDWITFEAFFGGLYQPKMHCGNNW